jgi:hypothetical protein
MATHDAKTRACVQCWQIMNNSLNMIGNQCLENIGEVLLHVCISSQFLACEQAL